MRKICIMAVGLLALSLNTGRADIIIGETGLNVGIPDMDLTGVARVDEVSAAAAGPYYVTVTLQIAGTGEGMWAGDYYAYLRHETTDGSVSLMSVLLNRVGRTGTDPFGYGESGMNVTLNDNGPSDVHYYQANLTGINGSALSNGVINGLWSPDGRLVDPLTMNGTEPQTAMLADLGTMDPNGRWILYVADVATGGTGELVSWQVQLTTIPEPTTAALLLLAAPALMAARKRWRARDKHALCNLNRDL